MVLFYVYKIHTAPIVQRIEHQPSKLAMGVRFSLGAQDLIIELFYN